MTIQQQADMCCNCKHGVELRQPTTDKEAMERPADLGCEAFPDVGVNPTWKSSWCPEHDRRPEDQSDPVSAAD